jgi:VanZ family protein
MFGLPIGWFGLHMWLLKLYHKKSVWLILFIACTAGIVLVSVIPYSPEKAAVAESGFRWDYLEHFLAFFSFGGLFVLWRSDRNYRISAMELVLLCILAAGFSWAIEYAQLFVPGRAFNVIDIMFNLAGVLSSILLVYFLVIRYYLRRRQSIIKA